MVVRRRCWHTLNNRKHLIVLYPLEHWVSVSRPHERPPKRPSLSEPMLCFTRMPMGSGLVVGSWWARGTHGRLDGGTEALAFLFLPNNGPGFRPLAGLRPSSPDPIDREEPNPGPRVPIVSPPSPPPESPPCVPPAHPGCCGAGPPGGGAGVGRRVGLR